jgi:hypothetical protein
MTGQPASRGLRQGLPAYAPSIFCSGQPSRRPYGDHSFASNLPGAQAEFMPDSWVPWGLDALNDAVSQSA